MLIIPPPLSNTERQRRFRERNPGYYGRLHRRRKADTKAAVLAMQAAHRAKVEAIQVSVVAEAAKTPLALPAPAIVFTFESLNAIPTSPRVEEREAVIIPREA